MNNLVFWGLLSAHPRRTLINAFGVRLLSIVNNIGVAAEILGMVVFAVILLIVGRHQDRLGPHRRRPASRRPRPAATCRSSRSRCS